MGVHDVGGAAASVPQAPDGVETSIGTDPTSSLTHTLQTLDEPVANATPTLTDTLQSLDEPVAGTVPTVTDTLDSTLEPVANATPTLTDTLQSLDRPVAGTVPTVTDTLDPTLDPVARSVPDPATIIKEPEVPPMGDSLQQATDPVTQTVGDPVQAVDNTVQQTAGDPVQAVDNTVQQAAGDPVQAVDNTVQQAAGDPVQAVDNTVQHAAGDPVQAVDNTVQQAAGDPVQAVDNTVQQTVGAAGQTIDNTAQTGSTIVDGSAVVGKGGAALDGATETIRQSTERLTDASGPLSDKVATILGQANPLASPSDVVAVVPNHLAEDVTATPLPAGIEDVGGPVAGGGGILDAIPFGGPDLLAGAEEAVILSAVAVAVTSVAITIRPSAVANAQFFLANARQIPAMCGGVSRQVSAAAAGSARLAGLELDQAVAGVRARAEDFTKAVSEGFRRGVDRGTAGAGTGDDHADDIRLLMQIGMLLGAAYVAFLTVWFWATRLRWSPRT